MVRGDYGGGGGRDVPGDRLEGQQQGRQGGGGGRKKAVSFSSEGPAPPLMKMESIAEERTKLPNVMTMMISLILLLLFLTLLLLLPCHPHPQLAPLLVSSRCLFTPHSFI